MTYLEKEEHAVREVIGRDDPEFHRRVTAMLDTLHNEGHINIDRGLLERILLLSVAARGNLDDNFPPNS